MSAVMSIADNLKRLRAEKRISQPKLSELSGVSQQLISQIETGKNTTTKYLPQIAKALGVQLDELDPSLHEFVHEPRRLSLEEEWLEDQAAIAAPEKGWSREVYEPDIPGAIPEIDVELGAGEGRVGEVISFPIGGEAYSAHKVLNEWYVPESYLDKLESRAANTVIMAVIGDSMVPSYQPGDRVIVDLSQNRLMSDTVYAISDGYGPPQIKRLQRVMFSEPPEVIVISDNTSHQSQTVPLGRLTIIGRIVGVVAKR